jgi:aminopeptidase-like protein
VNGGYPQYHTSADDLTLITPQALEASLAACRRIVEVMESNRRFVNLKPKGEPRLGARGLYGALGGAGPKQHEHAMLWLLNQSHGAHSLLDIARRSQLPLALLREAALALESAGLLAPAPEPGISVPRRKRPARRAAPSKRGRRKP